MKAEKLIAKGVEKHFDGQQLWFSVESLNEHYKGVKYHESDLDDEGFIKASDIFGDDIQEIEVEPIELGMTYEEAKKLLEIGNLIALPEWKGFWFNNIKTGETLVFTKEGEILETPIDDFKERNDWIVVDATPEQEALLNEYWSSLEVLVPEIEAEATAKTPEIEVKEEVVEFNEGSVSEVAETKVPDGLVKADYIDEAVETIEEIMPAKVVKTKADKK